MRRFGLAAGVGPAIFLALMLGVAFQVAAQSLPESPAPRWLADPKTGCKVWDPAPEPKEAVHWSGPCKNGLADGRGTLQWTLNGKPSDSYEGEYRAGKRNGHGVVTFRGGEKIEGDWRDDELLEIPPNEIDFRLRG